MTGFSACRVGEMRNLLFAYAIRYAIRFFVCHYIIHVTQFEL